MKRLAEAIAIIFSVRALSVVVVAAAEDGRKKKIALMTASLPWTFGPYQSQMHMLSLALADSPDERGVDYDLYWICGDDHLPVGVYETYEELRRHVPRTVPPPPGFRIDHLTFLGNAGREQRTASHFNALWREYGFDALVTLMDVTKVIPDEPFRMPVVAWIPLHSERVSPASVDYWVMREYHGIAGLAPSGARAIGDAVGERMDLKGVGQQLRKMFGSVLVDFIPHMFDREAIMSSADVALDLLKDHSVAEADAKLTGWPLVNRGQGSALESGHPRSLFGEERKDDFVILLQGGNYDDMDRKGWDTSLQAFARFYNSLKDPSGVHLHIHSMEDYLINADSNNLEEAPAAKLPAGYNIGMALYDHGLPRHAYTIDIAQHAPEVIAAYKKRASICLHPSKVEGFGMNVMECQIIGTPVITTNFTAMGDFTKIGRSVPHRQMIRNPGYLYDVALPDVIGIADAIGELYTEHLALKRGEKGALARREDEIRRFDEWLDSNCSPAVVGDKFRSLLYRSRSEFERRRAGRESVLSGHPPGAGAYAIASGYHAAIVDWDAPWTLLAPDGLRVLDPEALHRAAWTMLLGTHEDRPPPMVLALPARYEDGTDVPAQEANGSIHRDFPVLVRTFMVTALQPRMTRMNSLKFSAIQHAESGVMRLQDGLAIVDRNHDSNPNSGDYARSEL